jgi:hypothetical protein
MSPEQLRGDTVDARSDVFCAGILLYICLMGKNPFASEDSMRALIAVLETDPVRPPHLPMPLWAVIQRALAKEPNARYATAQEFAEALSSLKEEARRRSEPRISETTATVTDVRMLWKGTRRSTIGASVGLGIGIAACIGAVWIGASDSSARETDHTVAAQDEGVTRARRVPQRVVGNVDVVAGSTAATSPLTSASARASRRGGPIARDPGF